MAVQFDTTFEKGLASGSPPFSYVSNAGTVAGTIGNNPNRVLIGFAGFSAPSATVGTVTQSWNGVAETLLTSLDIPGLGSLFAFGLIAPATGANALSTNWSGGASTQVAGAVSLFNCDQIIGWQNVGTDSATSTNASSTVTSANGNAAVVLHGNANASSTTLSAGTAAWTETAFNGNYAQAYRLSISGSSVITYTLGSSVGWVNLKVDVIAFQQSSDSGIKTRMKLRPAPFKLMGDAFRPGKYSGWR